MVKKSENKQEQEKHFRHTLKNSVSELKTTMEKMFDIVTKSKDESMKKEFIREYKILVSIELDLEDLTK